VIQPNDRIEIRHASPGANVGQRGTAVQKDDEFDGLDAWLIELDNGRRLILPVCDFRKLNLLELIAEAARDDV
jgi:hypothetical protein